MRVIFRSAFPIAFVMLAHSVIGAQGQETARAVSGGGISVPGWTGKIDAGEEKAGQTLNNSKLEQSGNVLHVTTGPAVTYWNPANKASGNYTVHVHGAQVHERQRPSPPVRHHDRGE